MSTDEEPYEDHLAPFYYAVGRLVTSWGFFEQELDTIVRIIHSGRSILSPEKHFPKGFKNKVGYFQRTSLGYASDLAVIARFEATCKKIHDHSDVRHKIIHGFVLEFHPYGSGARFGRFDQGDPVAPHWEYDLTIEEILSEEDEIQNGARWLRTLSGELKARLRT